jgi:chromosome segregation ATPase
MEPARKALDEVGQLGDHFAKASLTRAEAMKELASKTQQLKDETKEMRQSPAFKALEKAAKSSSKGGSTSSPELQKQIDQLQQQMANGSASQDAMDKMKRDLDKAQEAASDLKNKSGQARKEAEEKLQQQLADLAKEAKEAGLSLPQLDEAIAALSQTRPDEVVKDLQMAEVELEKLRDMAKTLEKLQMQMDKLGKDLAEQLQNGQVEAAQSTLRKMSENLQSAKLTPEQMKKLLDEVQKAQKPGQEYGKAGDLLKQAAKQMSEGQKAEAGQSLQDAAKELDKMMAEMGDAQSVLQSLEALQQAQMAIGNGQAWANTPRPGRSKDGGKGEQSQGGGFGTWHDEDSWMYPEFKDKWENGADNRGEMDGRSTKKDGSLPDNLVATKVKGQMTPGGPMPSITMKGVSIKGQSKVDYKEMVGAAQSEAQGAISQDQVPRAYKGAVKDYFNDLKE